MPVKVQRHIVEQDGREFDYKIYRVTSDLGLIAVAHINPGSDLALLQENVPRATIAEACTQLDSLDGKQCPDRIINTQGVLTHAKDYGRKAANTKPE